MTNTYKVTILNLGHVDIEYSLMIRGVGCGTIMRIPQPCVAVEGNGLKLLLDTSYRSLQWIQEYCGAVENGKDEDERLLIGELDKIGWKPEDVDYVVNTHLHYDHCGQNNLFKGCKTKFIIQRKEWEFAFHPTPNLAYCYYPHLFNVEAVNPDQIFLIDGEYEVADGIIAFPTPGHTKGHQSVVVNTEEGVVCYAGDAANITDNLHQNIIGNILYDTAQAYQSMEEIRRRSEFVICGHEPSLKNYQSSGFARTHGE